ILAASKHLNPKTGLRHDTIAGSICRTIFQVRQPLARKKRHVAANNETPGMLMISRVSIHQSGDDAAKRPLARPLILYDTFAKFRVTAERRDHTHRPGSFLDQLAHPRQHGFAVQFGACFVDTKSGARASGHAVTDDALDFLARRSPLVTRHYSS